MATEEMKLITVEGDYIAAEEVGRLQREYWSKVKESDGFDIEDIIEVPPFGMPMRCSDFRKRMFIPNRILVLRYATAGLHRYNMLEGTGFELDALLKVNMTPNFVASYYITLVAHDPHAQAENLSGSS